MRLKPTETRILELFINDIFLEISINAISKKLDKHYRVVRVNVLSLLKKNLVKSRDIAGARVISLNLYEPTLPMYMAYVEETFSYNRIFSNLPQISDIIKRAREISPFFCLGIFGSYAGGAHKRGSDIDIFLICPGEYVKKYQNLIRQFPSVEDILDWNVFSAEEFKSGLKTKGALVYKEIIKNKMLVKGAGLFYNIIAEVGKIEKDKY